MNQDFETHPLGTGQELAQLNDENQALISAFELVRKHGFIEAKRLSDSWRDLSSFGTTSYALHNAVSKLLADFATVGTIYRKVGK